MDCDLDGTNSGKGSEFVRKNGLGVLMDRDNSLRRRGPRTGVVVAGIGEGAS